MSEKYTKEEIKKALEQADANLNFEEVNLLDISKEKESNSKTLKKELKK